MKQELSFPWKRESRSNNVILMKIRIQWGGREVDSGSEAGMTNKRTESKRI